MEQKKVLKISSKLIFSTFKWQNPGSWGVGKSILVSFHSVTNSSGEAMRVNVVFGSWLWRSHP
jgi:hypothetical protein